MLYNEELMYIRCTKCANSSLTDFFLNNDFRLLLPKSRKQHIDIIRQFSGEVIAVIRNPFSRLVSSFFDKMNPNVGIDDASVYIKNVFPSWYKIGIRHDTNIDQFVKIISDVPDYKIDHHLSSQSFRYLDKNNRLLINRLIPIEKLSEEIENLKDKYRLDGEVTKKNKVNHPSYSDILTNQSTMDRIYQRYKMDFEITSYKF